MESIVVALIGGVVTLVGVLCFNSKNRAVMEIRIDLLPKHVEKHDTLIERTYRLEQAVAVMKHDVQSLAERMEQMEQF